VHVRFEVHDTGIGIPEHQRERIFEAFRQQEGQSSRKYGGTGLGLAISRRLAEAMNGSLSLESGVGKGSSFFVDLPGVTVAVRKQPEPAASEREREAEEEETAAAGARYTLRTGPVSEVEEIREPEKLVSILEEELLPKWREIRTTMFVDDIHEFARELRSAAGRHGEHDLAMYAESLIGAAEAFDVELLSRLTEEFAERVEKVAARVRGEDGT
jgi:two-component system sensor histidine kinase EvgS